MVSGSSKSLEDVRAEVEKHIRSIMDFPKKGINFRQVFMDIMPLFAHPVIVNDLCKAIAQHIRADVGEINAIVALEARGFLFGPIIAVQLGVPFVPIRKKGKLPGECLQASYMKEYGEKDAICAGWKVVLIDDLLATGGTLKAAVDLIKKANATVSEAFVVIELAPLQGREKVPGIPVSALIVCKEA
ncbi:Adenine phosphoribosyl transferase [Trichostrongylus colubriformis]|uniref:Adenine phosphoribosyltransferase n=1 Tax=Trichostrongylus colubriformis TaxID=6319 RepID=A0AAN8F5S6_TRICO